MVKMHFQMKDTYNDKTYLYRGGEWAGANAGVCLNPNGVDGVWGEVADGGELVVVHKL